MSSHRKQNVRQRQGLTLFGEWFYRFCDYLGMTAPEVEKLVGLSAGTASKFTRGKTAPDPQTVKMLYDLFRTIAEQRGLEWNPDWEMGFLNAGGMAAPQDLLRSQEMLKTVPVTG